MKLIVWLGNPGTQYKTTRHNVWFMFLDRLCDYKKISSSWEENKKFKWEIIETFFAWEKTILLKPQTFMNLSGEAVMQVKNFYKIDNSDIFVIYDDISLDFEKIRYRDKWSAGGQNWVKSIISYIGEEFKRIKIWIGQDRRFDLSDWVLSKFKTEELEKLNCEIFEEAYLLLEKNL